MKSAITTLEIALAYLENNEASFRRSGLIAEAELNALRADEIRRDIKVLIRRDIKVLMDADALVEVLK